MFHCCQPCVLKKIEPDTIVCAKCNQLYFMYYNEAEFVRAHQYVCKGLPVDFKGLWMFFNESYQDFVINDSLLNFTRINYHVQKIMIWFLSTQRKTPPSLFDQTRLKLKEKSFCHQYNCNVPKTVTDSLNVNDFLHHTSHSSRKVFLNHFLHVNFH